MKLSPHVTRAEFEHSPTAVKHGISNEMSLEQIERAKLVCVNCFEPIRAYLKKPIKVNSGFRSLLLNKKIGGSKTSQHCKGEALDLDLHDRNLFNWIIDNDPFASRYKLTTYSESRGMPNPFNDVKVDMSGVDLSFMKDSTPAPTPEMSAGGIIIAK
jgi:hypothetical protein